jgi:hypothetical protein
MREEDADLTIESHLYSDVSIQVLMMGVSRAERMSGVERLGVTGDDIEKLRARKRREKLGRIILVGLAPIAGLTAGYIIGTAGQPEAAELTYPLAISAVYATGYTRSRPTLAAAVILGILAFAFATVLTSGAIAPDRPALMYSVYSADE